MTFLSSPEKRKHVSDEDTSNQPPTKVTYAQQNNIAYCSSNVSTV